MKLNLIFAGLQEDRAASVLERMEAVVKPLGENLQIACLNLGGESVCDMICAWLGHFTESALWQLTDDEACFSNMVQASVDFTDKNPADLVLVFGTDSGKKLGQQLAAKCGMRCHVDVQGFEYQEAVLYAARKIYSTHIDGLFAVGNSVEIISSSGSKAAYAVSEIPGSPEMRQVELDWEETEDFLVCEEAIPQMEDLSKAKLVLLGGKGLGSKTNFERMEALATKLGASCGCTRAVALAAWAPYDKVVGISGWKLQADVCIAFGVAGAGPLMQGVEGVGKLVAINNDKKAQIFRHADYGVVEDCVKILEAMENAIS